MLGNKILFISYEHRFLKILFYQGDTLFRTLMNMGHSDIAQIQWSLTKKLHTKKEQNVTQAFLRLPPPPPPPKIDDSDDDGKSAF